MAAELRWILLALSALLLIGICWWGLSRSRQSRGNAYLRETSTAPSTMGPTVMGPMPESDREPAGSRAWGVPPFEPLSIRTAEFDPEPVLDMPMSATADPLDVTLNMDYVGHELASRLPSVSPTSTATAGDAASKMQARAAEIHDTELQDTDSLSPESRSAEMHDTAPHDTQLHGTEMHDTEMHDAEMHDTEMHGAELHETELHGTEPHGTEPHGTEPHGTESHGTAARRADPYGQAYGAAHDSGARAVDMPATEPAAAAPASTSPVATASETQRIVTIRVCAAGDAHWPGADLLAALENHGLGYGRYKVFHRKYSDGRTLFCAASLVEPGTFDIARMPDEEFRGLTLFAVLPGPADALETIDMLIATAMGLADVLHGAVQDAKGASLSAQRAEALREDVARFQQSLSRP